MRRGDIVTVRDTPGRWRLLVTPPAPRGGWLLVCPDDVDAMLYLATCVSDKVNCMLRTAGDLDPVSVETGDSLF